MTETRSTIDPANLQEFIDASGASVKQTVSKGAAQYFTPPWFARTMAKLLPQGRHVIFDPQCGEGALLDHDTAGYACNLLGVEIDNRLTPSPSLPSSVFRLTANCVDVWRLLDELYPKLTFQCQVANPPFGLKWKVPGGESVDSTNYTWGKMIQRAGEDGMGYMIANKATIERLQLHWNPKVYLYQTFPVGIFDAQVEIGVLHFSGENTKPPIEMHHTSAAEADVTAICAKFDVRALRFYGGGTSSGDVLAAFTTIKELLAEEKRDTPPFNIYLGAQGYLRTYLSIRTKLERKLTVSDVNKLSRINNCHPLTLTTERDTRLLMDELISCGIYTVQPEAHAAIKSAIAQMAELACPIRPPTDFQCVAHADEYESLQALASTSSAGAVDGRPVLTKGKRYPITTGTYTFTNSYQAMRLHLDGRGGETYAAEHDMTLSGQDRFVSLRDDSGTLHRFLDKPDTKRPCDHSDALLWTYFVRPKIDTVAEKNPEAVAKNRAIMEACEMLAGFTYYDGQKDYYARVAVRDYALIAAATGTGKSLGAITLIALKAPARALIVAPQGTTRSSAPDDDEDAILELKASQWITELHNFAPGLQVFELFSEDDYERILALNGGVLPHGVYVSYYEAMFSNGARETATDSFTDDKLYRMLALPPPTDGEGHVLKTSALTASVGEERRGIRCIAKPCLATRIGHLFDFIALDEAHKAQKLSSNLTQMIIRLQPRYRFALTATPIPNLVTDIFPLMGWLCVPNWYCGGVRNAAWPYSREEGHKFSTTFLTTERDLTQEHMNREADEDWRGRCEKPSPVVSSPARLLKLITPTLAYIGKKECNPLKPECTVHDLRVPMGAQQAKLYGWFMERSHIPEQNPMRRAAKQVAILRDLCAAPASSDWNRVMDRLVRSNFNPKTAAILQKTADILQAGDQTVIVSSRLKQTAYLERRLTEAGVPVARIDSSLPPERHTEQANLFKSGRAAVMLMGIKCAQAHSFDRCPNLIVASLEYSFGSFEQASGRIDRVTSKRPMNIWCVLHQNSIEEIMFDVVATKGDAATICLRGQRVPRDFKPVDLGDILARNFSAFTSFKSSSLPDESTIEAGWPKLCAALRTAVQNHPCQLAIAA
jgi:superfamily II DNA or RNA helicase